MCGGGIDVRTPHQKLAELMSRELGVSINAPALRLFLKHHWSKVSVLAHAVHDEPENG
jgi:hypothetical protein